MLLNTQIEIVFHPFHYWIIENYYYWYKKAQTYKSFIFAEEKPNSAKNDDALILCVHSPNGKKQKIKILYLLFESCTDWND